MAARKKYTEPGTIFIRSVPADMLNDLDAAIVKMQKSDVVYRHISRNTFVLKLIGDALRHLKD